MKAIIEYRKRDTLENFADREGLTLVVTERSPGYVRFFACFDEALVGIARQIQKKETIN